MCLEISNRQKGCKRNLLIYVICITKKTPNYFYQQVRREIM